MCIDWSPALVWSQATSSPSAAMPAKGRTRPAPSVLPTARLPLYAVGDQTRAALLYLARRQQKTNSDRFQPARERTCRSYHDCGPRSGMKRILRLPAMTDTRAARLPNRIVDAIVIAGVCSIAGRPADFVCVRTLVRQALLALRLTARRGGDLTQPPAKGWTKDAPPRTVASRRDPATGSCRR